MNTIDTCIAYITEKYPFLLLVPPVPRKNTNQEETKNYATCMEDVASVPQDVVEALCTLLRFSSSLLRNSTNKNVYNSVHELADLLGAADDTVATLALDVLCSLAISPALHKQQAPEMQHHSTALHSKSTSGAAHGRLLALARGWGTRGSGLGLLQCVTADDSKYGQGSLPTEGGEVNFDFFSNETESLVTVKLTCHDIVAPSDRTDEEMSQQKRRKTSAIYREIQTRSTAQLFFQSVEQVESRIPENRLFMLLADIRLAKAFYSHQARVQAIENRLLALISILHAHPSQEIMSGYFQAQPELCVELIDLLRPTVSSASVSAAAARPIDGEDGDLQALSALANSPQVPYRVRSLSVEALTALVSRRDGSSGGLTGAARQSNVLSELGVGKGLYLGLLPTLIRYSLASLSTFLLIDEKKAIAKPDVTGMDATDAVGMDIGLAFVKATKPEPLPCGEQLRCALEFVDAVLTLTSSVVSAPSGTAALTDCGLIPALLSTVAIDAKSTPGILSESSSLDPEERAHSCALLRFITAQSIQIIEGAVVTHTNALSAFHDLQGVDVLTSRLSVEMEMIRQASDQSSNEITPMDMSEDIDMVDAQEQDARRRYMYSSQRVLLFSIVNCLTVVFHQESGTATASPLGGVQLRKPELTGAIKDIMEHVDSYGGVLAALIASLLSDIMNSDPQVVHHVHGSGLGESFLKMIASKSKADRPTLPPVAELIMALPTVLSAMSLTEDGATEVIKANPFPSLLRIFYDPEYAMPKSRCLLNEMTAIVGTGLDEIMRHVPRHRPLVMKAIVEAMQDVVGIGSKLAEQEEALDLTAQQGDAQLVSLEEQRTCLMQYALNFGQMLEQILHNEEHCDPFVKAGGLDAILDLFPYLMPSGSRFLAHVSCLSCPSVCTLTHSTTEHQLSMSFKCIALHYNSGNLFTKMIAALEAHLDSLGKIQRELRQAFSDLPSQSIEGDEAISAEGILEHLPRVPLHDAVESADFGGKSLHLSKYLRAVVELQWLSNLFAGVIRAGCQRSQESGAGWGRNEFKWKKELFSSPVFQRVISEVSLFYQSSNLEVCRMRTEDGFEERDRSRLKKGEVGTSRVRYRLRIVCQEGAVVRDGMEIDLCASVGSMEMGEVAEAFDRCVNSSGVMRYRTWKGWVSELTRGHGREPIAEVLSVWNAQDESPRPNPTVSKEKQFNCGIADVCSVSASVLARLQSSYCELFSSLSRDLVQSFKVISVRSMSFDQGTVGGYLRGLLEVLCSNVKQGLSNKAIADAINVSSSMGASSNSSLSFATSSAGISMYIGAQLGHLQACLFEDKRERRNLNVPLLVRLLYTDEDDAPTITPSRPFFFEAIQFLFRQSLSDLQKSASSTIDQLMGVDAADAFPRQCLSRTVAASLPPAITLMDRLIPSSTVLSSTLTSMLSSVNDSDRFVLMANGALDAVQKRKNVLTFHPEYFTKVLQCAVAECLLEVWKDPRFVFVPAQVVHPIASLAGEVIASLDEASKASSNSSECSRSGRGHWDLFSRSARSLLSRQRDGDDEENVEEAAEAARANFEPSEEAISQLTDMGFSREHALDALESTRSNRVDVAMEYALSISHLTSAELATRRAAREERVRRTIAAQGGVAIYADSTANNEGTAGMEESQDTAARDENMADGGSYDEGTKGGDANKDRDKEKTKTTDSPDELLAKRMETCRRSWVESASRVAVNVMSGANDSSLNEVTESSSPARRDDGKGQGDADAEAVTVVLSRFLLDLCQRYPDERTNVVSQLLDRLTSLFSKAQNDGEVSWDVPSESALSFASLCHAAFFRLCTRALPMTRVLVLPKGIVRRLVSSIQTCIQSRVQPENSHAHGTTWPTSGSLQAFFYSTSWRSRWLHPL